MLLALDNVGITNEATPVDGLIDTSPLTQLATVTLAPLVKCVEPVFNATASAETEIPSPAPTAKVWATPSPLVAPPVKPLPGLIVAT